MVSKTELIYAPGPSWSVHELTRVLRNILLRATQRRQVAAWEALRWSGRCGCEAASKKVLVDGHSTGTRRAETVKKLAAKAWRINFKKQLDAVENAFRVSSAVAESSLQGELCLGKIENAAAGAPELQPLDKVQLAKNMQGQTVQVAHTGEEGRRAVPELVVDSPAEKRRLDSPSADWRRSMPIVREEFRRFTPASMDATAAGSSSSRFATVNSQQHQQPSSSNSSSSDGGGQAPLRSEMFSASQGQVTGRKASRSVPRLQLGAKSSPWMGAAAKARGRQLVVNKNALGEHAPCALKQEVGSPFPQRWLEEHAPCPFKQEAQEDVGGIGHRRDLSEYPQSDNDEDKDDEDDDDSDDRELPENVWSSQISPTDGQGKHPVVPSLRMSLLVAGGHQSSSNPSDAAMEAVAPQVQKQIATRPAEKSMAFAARPVALYTPRHEGQQRQTLSSDSRRRQPSANTGDSHITTLVAGSVTAATLSHRSPRPASNPRFAFTAPKRSTSVVANEALMGGPMPATVVTTLRGSSPTTSPKKKPPSPAFKASSPFKPAQAVATRNPSFIMPLAASAQSHIPTRQSAWPKAVPVGSPPAFVHRTASLSTSPQRRIQGSAVQVLRTSLRSPTAAHTATTANSLASPRPAATPNFRPSSVLRGPVGLGEAATDSFTPLLPSRTSQGVEVSRRSTGGANAATMMQRVAAAAAAAASASQKQQLQGQGGRTMAAVPGVSQGFSTTALWTPRAQPCSNQAAPRPVTAASSPVASAR